ncbi:beta-CASP ribonuclease aCPSF1 [[Eubacterium] cellulosolvens]
MTVVINDTHVKIRDCIIEHVPKEAEVTRIEFEGPRLAVYVKNVSTILDQSYIVTDIVNILHKRVVIRSDPSIRLKEQNAEAIIKSLIPSEAEVINVSFDPSLGEVIIEAKKPGLAIGKDGSILQEMIKATSWRPKVLRGPLIPSKIITTTRHMLQAESEERSRILRDIGERIFRPTLTKVGAVRITPLGGAHEVGRSSILVETDESKVLLDFGIHPSTSTSSQTYPRIDLIDFNIESVDAVILSHAHIDHCALVPFLFKYGYDGPVYCSEPTASLMTLLQLDYLDVAGREGSYAPYDQKDVKDTVMHTIPLKHGVVTDVAPDIKLTLHNAGHILGSSIIHLHIGEGFQNIVYTGDFKFGKSMLLESSSSSFPRAETLITESTYGGMEDVMADRSTVEKKFTGIIDDTLRQGGKILIPVPAVGRAQEIMLILDKYMKNNGLTEVPIYLEGMIAEATAIHTAYPEYLAKEIRDQILHHDVNPFQSSYFTIVNHPSERSNIISGGPAIIMATSGMLEGGPAIDYFKNLAPDERNSIIFVSYQIEGTLGNRIKNGLKEVSLQDQGGKIELIKINAKIEMVEGFSGHSDKRQLIGFIQKMSPRPAKVIVCHGERKKCDNLAQGITKILNIKAIAPEINETIRLR